MKSSSCFVCQACGCAEWGWDMSMSEAEMVESTCGHIFCAGHLEWQWDREALINVINKSLEYYENLNNGYDYSEKIQNYKNSINYIKSLDDNDTKNVDEILEDIGEKFDVRGLELEYQIPEEHCPVCNYSYLNNENKLRYLMEKYNIIDEDLVKEIQEVKGVTK
jgi:hypothetical protein